MHHCLPTLENHHHHHCPNLNGQGKPRERKTWDNTKKLSYKKSKEKIITENEGFLKAKKAIIVEKMKHSSKPKLSPPAAL